jgi:hypothetical protein
MEKFVVRSIVVGIMQPGKTEVVEGKMFQSHCIHKSYVGRLDIEPSLSH